MKKILTIIFLICFNLFAISHSFSVILANCNYINNNKIWNDLNYNGIIYSQGNYEELKYGVGNIAANGCGAIAVYNILVLENKYKPLPKIIKYFDTYNEVLYGVLGTNPFSIINYMNSIGYKAKAHLNVKNFKEQAVKSKYSILVYFNLNGGHYQLMYDYNVNNDTFKFINSTTTRPLEILLQNTNDCFRALITIN